MTSSCGVRFLAMWWLSSKSNRNRDEKRNSETEMEQRWKPWWMLWASLESHTTSFLSQSIFLRWLGSEEREQMPPPAEGRVFRNRNLARIHGLHHAHSVVICNTFYCISKMQVVGDNCGATKRDKHHPELPQHPHIVRLKQPHVEEKMLFSLQPPSALV